MKTLCIILFTSLLSTQLFAQQQFDDIYGERQFSFIPYISIGSSVVSSNGVMVSHSNCPFNTETNLGFTSKASLMIEYSLNKRFILGVEPSYQYQSLSLKGGYSGPHIPEDFIYHKHQINSQIIKVPIVLKYQMKNYYWLGKYGLSAMVYSKYDIERCNYDMHTPEDITVIKINSGTTNITNNNTSFGHFFEIGFGKELHFKKITFIIELVYNQDINTWLYKPIEPSFTNEITFRAHGLILNFGMKI